MAHAIIHALSLAGSMTWEILWALILGFALSAVVQAIVRRSTVVALLGDDRPRTLAVAAGLGAASSSCSYAAVALARSLFRKGANFTAAMAFEIGSTNLVVELGDHLGPADGLAVHRGGIRRRAGHDRGARRAVPVFRAVATGRRRPQAGRRRTGRFDGRPCGHGHVGARRRLVSAAAAVAGRLYLGVPCLRDGVGGHPARFGHRTADRGRHRGVGARILLAAVLFH